MALNTTSSGKATTLTATHGNHNGILRIMAVGLFLMSLTWRMAKHTSRVNYVLPEMMIRLAVRPASIRLLKLRTLDADEQDKAAYESSQSRRDKRREWAIRANMVKNWQETSAAQWITSYATTLHPRPTPSVNTVSSHNGVPGDPDEPGGEVYETVKELMRVQHLEGDPLDFIPGYKKELENVTKMRLKEVSPAVAQYVRQKKLAVRLRMLLEVKRDMRRKGRLVLQGFRAPSW